MDGLIIVDKPAGLTSHDVVIRLRKILKTRRIGHTGTLDPLATGVLLVTVGQATRLFPYLSTLDKTYSGEIRLGISTDTYDAEGRPLGPEIELWPDEEKLRKEIESFLGAIEQLPPPYSAKKINGQPAFKLARQGLKPELKPVPVTIYRFLILDYQPPFLKFLVDCSSGTYIRSLAHDLGQKLGCGGHLTGLRRLAVGPYTEEEALSLEKINELFKSDNVEGFLIPLDKLLPDFPAVWLDGSGARWFINGVRIALSRVTRADLTKTKRNPVPIYRVFSEEGRLLGLATFQENSFQPELVFNRSFRS